MYKTGMKQILLIFKSTKIAPYNVIIVDSSVHDHTTPMFLHIRTYHKASSLLALFVLH